MAAFPTAQPGEKLVLVHFKGEESSQNRRLRVIGSNPAEFRTINVDREPSLRIDGHDSPLLWLPEAGGCYVSIPSRKNMVLFSEIPLGSEIEVVSYAKPPEEEKKPPFDESKPHTLADFVAESMKCGIAVEGLPEGVKAAEAAEVFGKMQHVDLKPVVCGEHYFYGWFPTEGKKVQTNAGVHLFTIISTEFLTKGHRLIIEPAAQELLRRN